MKHPTEQVQMELQIMVRPELVHFDSAAAGFLEGTEHEPPAGFEDRSNRRNNLLGFEIGHRLTTYDESSGFRGHDLVDVFGSTPYGDDHGVFCNPWVEVQKSDVRVMNFLVDG